MFVETTQLILKILVKTGKNAEGIKPRIRYVCDTSKSLTYYTTRDRENKSTTPMSRDTKRSNKSPLTNITKELRKLLY